MDQMTVCTVKGVAPTDKPTDIITNCSFPQLYKAFQRISAHCFGFTGCNFIVLVHSHRSHQYCFQEQQAAVFIEKDLIEPLYTTCPAPNGRETKLTTN